jgi:serine-type D-Ala-D-Ala carboxypeptidase (penicillin-binding protein 5/6)
MRVSMIRWTLLVSLVLCHSVQAVPFEGVPEPPALEVKAYVLLDFATGEVIAEQNADTQVEPASLTKIMTVYSVADGLRKGLIKLEDRPVVSEHAWKQEGSRMFIEVGKEVSVDELLHGDIIQSGNDASVALAEHLSGTEEVFATVMNAHAKRLGMNSSSFANSTGLPNPGTYTTARDMAVLARALIQEFPDVYRLFSIPEYTYNGITQHNRNGLLGRDPTVDGMKTGFTDAAGYCLVASARRDGMRLVSVVMGAGSDGARTQASQALLNYGFRFFESRQLYAAKAAVATGRVWQGEVDEISVGLAEDLVMLLPRGDLADTLKVVAELQKPLRAPLSEGQEVGEMRITWKDKPVRRLPLVTLKAVPEGSWVKRGMDAAKLMLE